MRALGSEYLRSCYDLKVHFWWSNKHFIWGRSSWKTLYMAALHMTFELVRIWIRTPIQLMKHLEISLNLKDIVCFLIRNFLIQFRVSHIEMKKVNLLWQIDRLSFSISYLRWPIQEVMTFGFYQPVFKKVILAGLNSLWQKGCQISVKNWIFDDPFYKKGLILIIWVLRMIKPSGSIIFLMKWGCQGHWGHWGCWGLIRIFCLSLFPFIFLSAIIPRWKMSWVSKKLLVCTV